MFFQIHFPYSIPGIPPHISVPLSCVKITPGLVCSLFAPCFTPRIELESKITHCSSEMGPAQLLLVPYSFNHFSWLVNIELFIQNKWCSQAELGELYLQGSSWAISMLSCLWRPRFVSFCWVFQPAGATRDLSLSRTKQNHRTCRAGRDPQAPRVTSWTQQCCPDIACIKTLVKKN